MSQSSYPMPANFGSRENPLNSIRPKSIQQSNMQELISRPLLPLCLKMAIQANANHALPLDIGTIHFMPARVLSAFTVLFTWENRANRVFVQESGTDAPDWIATICRLSRQGGDNRNAPDRPPGVVPTKKGKTMSVGALNFKRFEKGAMCGFLDLRYHGLTIKGVRLMAGNGGLWLAFPQQKGEQDGETKWFDQMFLTKPEAEHVRRLVVADLRAQGHIQAPARGGGGNGQPPWKTDHGDHQPTQHRQGHRSPEGEDLSDYYTHGAEDDIPF